MVKSGFNSLKTTHLTDSFTFPIETSADIYSSTSQVFDIHLRGHVESSRFLQNEIRWAITDPHFTSSKLLNASGWDDILVTGVLSPWTIRQRFVTIRLLNDTFTNDAGARNSLVTVAAVQSLLGFEVSVSYKKAIIFLEDISNFK
jgi:hypothetical protein